MKNALAIDTVIAQSDDDNVDMLERWDSNPFRTGLLRNATRATTASQGTFRAPSWTLAHAGVDPWWRLVRSVGTSDRPTTDVAPSPAQL